MAATTSTTGTGKDAFVTVPGDRHSEVAHTLAEPVPQSLGLLDQFGLWGNLGVSLLGFTGAIFVLQPGGAGSALADLEGDARPELVTSSPRFAPDADELRVFD